ncbi:NXF1 factor, partial [Amia calva]|nr:NXF1 factor [Amia calva]
LEHNPLCENFKDQPSYISAIREKFPRLLRLDGHVLPRLITFEIDPPTTLPACKGSTSVGRKVKRVIQRFLQECSLEGYKTSSNVKEPKDPTSWFHLQKQTRQGVVALLSELPKTQHDPSSFVVDVHTSTVSVH